MNDNHASNMFIATKTSKLKSYQPGSHSKEEN